MATSAELISDRESHHGFDTSVAVDLPPLGILIYQLTEAAELSDAEVPAESTSTANSDDKASQPDASEPAG